MSHLRETCGKNPGLGIGDHPQWSPRSSVWLQDPVFTTWPQEAFLFGFLLLPTHSALSSSHLLPSPPMYLHSLFTSNTLPSPRLYLCFVFPLALPSAMQGKLLFTWIYSGSNIISNTHIHAHPRAPCGIVVISVNRPQIIPPLPGNVSRWPQSHILLL